ncbi:MAG: peptidoglycan DD-metalloendopeptidase family protein [Pseudomonadota bacterium]
MTAALIVLFLPLTLSAVLGAVWHLACTLMINGKDSQKRVVLTPTAEGLVLAAMVMPMVVGTLICFIPLSDVAILPDDLVPALLTVEMPRAAAEAAMMIPQPVRLDGTLIICLLWIVYAIGVLRGLLGLVLSHFYLRGLIRKGTDFHTMKGTPYPDECVVRITAATVPPLVTRGGAILIPRALLAALEPSAITQIIDHERCHWRRGDPHGFLALALVARLCWFNPFVHHQIARCRLAAELACDADVLARTPRSARKAYARTLIHAARLLHTVPSRQSVPLETVPCFIPRSAKGDIEMRLNTLMRPNGQKTGPSRRVLAVVCGTLMVGSAGLGASAQITLADARQDASGPTFTVSPLVGKITSRFGLRHDPFSAEKKHHRGTDIRGETDDPIYAPAAGRVVSATFKPGYGNLLTLDHGNGFVTRYGQLNSFAVQPGARVAAGTLIARVGATGPHLHLELLIDGEYADPEAHITLGPQPISKP